MEDAKNKKLTPADVRKLCKAGNIVYIPHHECACCGRPVGWNLRWGSPVEVEFDPSCDCGSGGRTGQDWHTVADWVLNEDGTLREEYNWIADSVQGTDANSVDASDTPEAFKAGVEWQQCHKGCDHIEAGTPEWWKKGFEEGAFLRGIFETYLKHSGLWKGDWSEVTATRFRYRSNVWCSKYDKLDGDFVEVFIEKIDDTIISECVLFRDFLKWREKIKDRKE